MLFNSINSRKDKIIILKNLYEYCFIESTRNYLNPELLTNKTVPRLVFMQLKQELQEKNNAISILSEKVSALESQVEIKDQRIYDLTAQILSTNQIFNAPIPASRSGTSNKLRKSNTIIN